MANILILIGAHLCTAPRPQKEADTLAAAGHNVTVGGVWFDPILVERDRQLMTTKSWRFVPILDFQPIPAQRWQRWGVRFQARMAREGFQRWGIFSPGLLGYGAKAMLKWARQTQADLTIVHSEAGLWVGSRLLQDGFKVGVDFEDWFSEDLLPHARKIRPVATLRSLECQLLQACLYCLAPSAVMAAALAQRADAPHPTVIYNTFPRAAGMVTAAQQTALPSLHWFSHTIGPGRGLETLFAALPLLRCPVDIHLRGNYPPRSRDWLEPLVPQAWRSHLHLHPTVPNAELPARIAEHDIGLALETPHCPSRDLTVTNKLFQYLQAGLAIIATDTAGQREVLSQCPAAGTVIPCDDSAALAHAIDHWTENRDRLRAAQQAAFIAGQTQFCWETQAERLAQAAAQALATPVHSPVPPVSSPVLQET